MDVFITGGTGFVGHNLIRHLHATQPSWTLHALVRHEGKAKALQALGVQCHLGDLLQADTYRHIVSQCGLIFHLAGLVGLKDGEAFYSANVGSMNTLIEAAQGADNLKRLVFVSSISAIDRPANTPINSLILPLTEQSPACPTTDYGKSKHMAELALQVSGIPYTIIRPSYIHGPYPRPQSSMDRALFDVLAQAPYTRFPFPGKASEIDVEDLAQAIALSALHLNTLNKAYFISNPSPISMPHFFATMANALGIPFHPTYVSPQALRRIQERAYRQNTAPAARLMQRILFEDFFACSPKAFMEDTGFQPSYSLQSALRRTVLWYKEAGLLPS